MGYLRNHLATVVTAGFASVLSLVWFIMNPMFPSLNFIFMMAIPISWFLVLMCWLVQKGQEYSNKHNYSEKSEQHSSTPL